MKNQRVFIVIVVVALLVGWATERVMSTGTKYPPTTPSAVKIYLSQKPAAPCEEIGRASVDKYDNFAFTRSADEMNAKLKEQAASIGEMRLLGSPRISRACQESSPGVNDRLRP